MKSPAYLLRLATFGICVSLSTFWASLSLAQLQIPTTPQPELKIPQNTNIDSIPNYPQQLKTWSCSKSSQAALVEAKEVKNWSETIAQNGWTCQEKLSAIPDNAPQFSCETETPIDIITATWLAGEGGKQQMQAWMNAFLKLGMTCTADKTNPFWN